MSFRKEFIDFLTSTGVPFEECAGGKLLVPSTSFAVRPVSLAEAASGIGYEEGVCCLFEDRWMRRRPLIEARLRAHMGLQSTVFARKCTVEKIPSGEAAAFLEENHVYGSCTCRYRYGLRCEGNLVAVSTFSKARNVTRRFENGERRVRSYEWVRFASLPGVRCAGGMGRLLEAFIRDVNPEDIMSYADLEWSSGAVYRTLGFTLHSLIPPRRFLVTASGERIPFNRLPQGSGTASGTVIANLGSAKYVRTF